MNKLTITLLFLSGCASIPPGEGFYSCDAIVAGDYDDRFAKSSLTREDLNRGVRVALDAATLTTDIELSDQVRNCRRLMGFRVYTKKEFDFLAPWDNKTSISGYASCQLNMIVVGTPTDGNWRDSSLVHELFHAMQDCSPTPPEDVGLPSPGHDNWIRDGIFSAIEWSRRQP
jgi:hypothetical protein